MFNVNILYYSLYERYGSSLLKSSVLRWV